MTSVGWDNNSGDEDDWEGRLFIKQLVLEAFSMLDVFQEIRNWNSELGVIKQENLLQIKFSVDITKDELVTIVGKFLFSWKA